MSAYAIKNDSGQYWTGKKWAELRNAKEWATLTGASNAAKIIAQNDTAQTKLYIIQTV